MDSPLILTGETGQSAEYVVIHEQTFKLYEFGPFRLSLNDRLLYTGDSVVPLTPKLVDTLIVLVEKSGHVVTKHLLMDSLWPDSFVEKSSLTQNISLLRRALAETDRGQYIETIPNVAIASWLTCEKSPSVIVCRRVMGRRSFTNVRALNWSLKKR